MKINLDVVIDAPEYSVDMKAGLNSLQGVSDTIRCIAETVAEGKVFKRQSHKGKVRTNLKKTFKGSYGQEFSLDIEDDEYEAKLKKIGKGTFVELISYFVNESLYRESDELTTKASKVIESLGETSEDLIEHLRNNKLENVHDVSTKFGYDLQIRHRNSQSQKTVLARVDRDSVKVLKPIKSDEKLNITASVTRFNIYTGNGRLQLKGAGETVPFGFSVQYKTLKIRAKKVFSENLDDNNGISENLKYLPLTVQMEKLKSGKVVKYYVIGIHDD